MKDIKKTTRISFLHNLCILEYYTSLQSSSLGMLRVILESPSKSRGSIPSKMHQISPILSMFTLHTLVGSFITFCIYCFDCVNGFLSCVLFLVFPFPIQPQTHRLIYLFQRNAFHIFPHLSNWEWPIPRSKLKVFQGNFTYNLWEQNLQVRENVLKHLTDSFKRSLQTR